MKQNEEKIKVIIRCWPMIDLEWQKKSQEVVQVDCNNNQIILFDSKDGKSKPISFPFDKVYDSKST